LNPALYGGVLLNSAGPVAWWMVWLALGVVGFAFFALWYADKHGR
jgi:hypothetical protein